MDDTRLADFWAAARAAEPTLPPAVPAAWAFGATPAQADDLLALVLAGVKTATASALDDYDVDGDPLPRAGDANIVLDGRDRPRAVIVTSAVEILPFAEVTAEHAWAEGEGDRSLAHWRAEHEEFWRAVHPSGFRPDMPVVCERFRLVYR
ncbi:MULTISPECIES: ASCH domain-containing protein [unclassified Brevibacterium]|uniref:ASCH domain-containing protein n=1 Tax=unclassified Brevibacterium TaxID=2614124 RepID=UPI0010F6019A|nr:MULTISPECIES: ASCH domain-containing protein [unclassified Brevibacterium]MCM1011864.1 ASCH domain-containing protein [Brevibacterium sp. XM4083]